MLLQRRCPFMLKKSYPKTSKGEVFIASKSWVDRSGWKLRGLAFHFPSGSWEGENTGCPLPISIAKVQGKWQRDTFSQTELERAFLICTKSRVSMYASGDMRQCWEDYVSKESITARQMQNLGNGNQQWVSTVPKAQLSAENGTACPVTKLYGAIPAQTSKDTDGCKQTREPFPLHRLLPWGYTKFPKHTVSMCQMMPFQKWEKKRETS